MNQTRAKMSEMLLRLRVAVQGDFAGVAMAVVGDNRLYRWACVNGSISGHCEAMLFRRGSGVGGQTLRIGKMVIWNTGTVQTDRLRQECPLMQVESLCSVISAPIVSNGKFQGVLVVGARTNRVFLQTDAELVKHEAEIFTNDTSENKTSLRMNPLL